MIVVQPLKFPSQVIINSLGVARHEIIVADIVTALYGFCMIKLSAATRGKLTSFFKLFARSTVVKLHQEIKTRICILS